MGDSIQHRMRAIVIIYLHHFDAAEDYFSLLGALPFLEVAVVPQDRPFLEEEV